MRPAFLSLVCGLTLVAAACNHDAEKVEPPSVGEAFPTVLLPPDGRVISRSGSADALQFTFSAPHGVSEMASYYRDAFSSPDWNIVADVTDTAGVVSIHVDWAKTDQPMWVRISPTAGGSQVELAGAVPTRDSSYVRREKVAKDSSNTFVPR